MHKNESFKSSAGIEASEKIQIDKLDTVISELIQTIEQSGLDMQKWNDNYEDLPEDLEAFQIFYRKLLAFNEKRHDALMSYEFGADMSEQEKADIRRFDREIMTAFQDPEQFLGNGASAEVYSMSGNDALCVKFITNQERYNENNHLRAEFDLLSRVYSHTKDQEVRTPYPTFLRIHPKDGHSYGMEKIHGASLSQILEFPDKYADLIETALGSDPTQLEAFLQEFVNQMHEAGVTHGDMFKRNIMLDSNGRLFVIDFGKAKKIEIAGERDDAKKSDLYCARLSLRDFFTQLNELTDKTN